MKKDNIIGLILKKVKNALTIVATICVAFFILFSKENKMR